MMEQQVEAWEAWEEREERERERARDGDTLPDQIAFSVLSVLQPGMYMFLMFSMSNPASWQ